jgi:nitrile hydratase accessory protein
MTESLKELMESAEVPSGDVTFAEPWEARAFGLAVTLASSGRFAWEEFRQRLIAEIAAADAAAGAGQRPATYYECWLVALEKTVSAKGMAGTAEIDSRAEVIAANPPLRTKAISAGPVRIA